MDAMSHDQIENDFTYVITNTAFGSNVLDNDTDTAQCTAYIAMKVTKDRRNRTSVREMHLVPLIKHRQQEEINMTLFEDSLKSKHTVS